MYKIIVTGGRRVDLARRIINLLDYCDSTVSVQASDSALITNELLDLKSNIPASRTEIDEQTPRKRGYDHSKFSKTKRSR